MILFLILGFLFILIEWARSQINTPIKNSMAAPTTKKAFNKFWKDFIGEEYSGLRIENEVVISYLHNAFGEEISRNPEFTFYFAYFYFDAIIIYSNSEDNAKWEHDINKLLKLR